MGGGADEVQKNIHARENSMKKIHARQLALKNIHPMTSARPCHDSKKSSN